MTQTTVDSGSSTFRISVEVPRRVVLNGKTVDRDTFYSWLWQEFGDSGLLGVHEGTLLSAEAVASGIEADSWTVDAAEAPRERDWVSEREVVTTELYFATEAAARTALDRLRSISELQACALEEEPERDWNEEWKKHFLSSPSGVEIPPNWRIIPPWVENGSARASEVVVKINPGAGFGTGTHETTQLCLQALAECARSSLLRDQPVLDFGSGSGILSIGAALLGARVHAVEIDPLANENAESNAKLNQVEARISISTRLGKPGETYALILANILRPILLEHADALVSRLAPRGSIILSGLIASDVEAVTRRYSELLGRPPAHALEKNEWRALVWDRRA